MFRVMTYNLLFGGVGREHLIRETVREVNPDVAVFCEVTSEETLEAIAGVIGNHRARSCSGRTHVAVVSRWPILKADALDSVWTRTKWVAATIQPAGAPTICVSAVHLVPQPLWPFELARLIQVRVLLGRLQARACPLHVIAGDFNAVAPGDRVRQRGGAGYVRAQWWLQAAMIPRWAVGRLINIGYTDCYRACNPNKDGFTVASWNPQVRVDYLFASPALTGQLRSSDVLEPKNRRGAPVRRSVAQFFGSAGVADLAGQASDHLPVWADFAWPTPGDVGRRAGLSD